MIKKFKIQEAAIPSTLKGHTMYIFEITFFELFMQISDINTKISQNTTEYQTQVKHFSPLQSDTTKMVNYVIMAPWCTKKVSENGHQTILPSRKKLETEAKRKKKLGL